MTCLIGERPGKSRDRCAPSRPIFLITCCVCRASAGSSGTETALIFPTTTAALYCPPCPPDRPVPDGKRSFGPLGTRPELFTTSEEFSTPVPLPLPMQIVPPTTAIADGYCPVGINPRTVLRSAGASSHFSPSALAESSTTATELLCELATYKSSPLNASPSGLLPGGTVSDNRTLMRSISLSVVVSITDTLSSFELATYKRARSALSNIAVG